MASIVLHRAHLGCCPQSIGHTLCGALVIGGKTHPDMAIVKDCIVGAVSLFDLIERLGDQEGLDPIARHEGQSRLEKVEPSKRWKLIEHEQHPVAAILRVQVFSQPPPDLVEDQTDQRFGAADV